MLVPDHAVVWDRRAAQRAIDQGDFHAGETVQRHLVPRQYPLGVGAGLAVERNTEHDMPVPEVAGLVGRQVARVIQGRDAVDLHAAPLHLVKPDQRARGGREEGAHSRIDKGVCRLLEQEVPGVRVVGLLPDPPHPPLRILAQVPSRLPPQEAVHLAPGLREGGDHRQFDHHRGVRVAPGIPDGIQERPRLRALLRSRLKEQVESRDLPSGVIRRCRAAVLHGQRHQSRDQCRNTPAGASHEGRS